MKKYFLAFIFFISCFKYPHAQEISQESFDSLLTNHVSLYFDNKNKRYFGCGMNLDCMGLPVVFTKISIDSLTKQLRLSGYVNPMLQNNGDTLGTNIFKLFIARPAKGRLKYIRLLAEVHNTVIQKSADTDINLKTLNFKTDFKFSKHDCLYIESVELFRLKEYNIGKLLK